MTFAQQSTVVKKKKKGTYKERDREKKNKTEVTIISPINQGILSLIFFNLETEIGTKKGNSKTIRMFKGRKQCFCTIMLKTLQLGNERTEFR